MTDSLGDQLVVQRQPSPEALVSIIGARHGVNIPPTAADAIAAALLAYGDSICEVRDRIPRRAWEDERYREKVLRHLRLRLLEAVADEGRVPSTVPKQTVRYMTYPYFAGINESEVPAHYAEAGAAWESIEIALMVFTRLI